LDTSDSFQPGDVSNMAGFLYFEKLRIPISFPNISHSYWKYYHLTGDYYIRPTRLTQQHGLPTVIAEVPRGSGQPMWFCMGLWILRGTVGRGWPCLFLLPSVGEGVPKGRMRGGFPLNQVLVFPSPAGDCASKKCRVGTAGRGPGRGWARFTSPPLGERPGAGGRFF
jgi:hypothetical protein